MKITFKTAWFLVWLSLFGLLAMAFGKDGFTTPIYTLTILALMAAASSFVITILISAFIDLEWKE